MNFEDEQPLLLTGYISNTSNPDKIFNEETLANLLARKDDIKEHTNQLTKQAENDYKLGTALNIGGGALQIGASLIPFGGLGTAMGSKLLTPIVGKAIGGAIGSGVASGAISGGLYGMGDAISKAKPINEIAQEGLQGVNIGASTEGLLGGVGGKVGQILAKTKVQFANKFGKLGLETLDDGTKIADLNKNYFDNYVNGLYNANENTPKLFSKLNFKSKPLHDYRALTQGLNPKRLEDGLLYDKPDPFHINKNEKFGYPDFELNNQESKVYNQELKDKFENHTSYSASDKILAKELNKILNSQSVAQNGKGNLVYHEGKLGFWSKTIDSVPFFREVENRNGLYYIKGSEQLYLPPDEYSTVMKRISPNNLTRKEFESNEFSKEINGTLYYIKKTDDGWIITNKGNKRK